jgi:hypothetical protein
MSKDFDHILAALKLLLSEEELSWGANNGLKECITKANIRRDAWVAQDNDGYWFLYADEPELDTNSAQWLPQKSGDMDMIARSDISDNWRRSMLYIKNPAQGG